MQQEFNPQAAMQQNGGQQQQQNPEEKFFNEIIQKWKQSKGGTVSFDAEAGFRDGLGSGIKLAAVNQQVLMHDQKLFPLYSMLVSKHLDEIEEAEKNDKSGDTTTSIAEKCMKTATHLAKVYGNIFNTEVRELVEEAKKGM
jgi:hypothetical protein